MRDEVCVHVVAGEGGGFLPSSHRGCAPCMHAADDATDGSMRAGLVAVVMSSK